jgi:hypothetical protein
VKTIRVLARNVSVSRLNTHLLDIGEGRSVAYQTIPGQRKPTIVMIPGLHSYTHMSGTKASCLLRYRTFPCRDPATVEERSFCCRADPGPEAIYSLLKAVLGIRIRMFLGLLDPDLNPLVRGVDPDPDP